MKPKKSKNLHAIASKYNIGLIYIFGSQVQTAKDLLDGIKKNPADRLTDIDIGLVFLKELPGPKERIKLYSSIYNELEDLIAPFPLDLVFLQETHSVFQARAICGECIYCVSKEYKEEYEDGILRRAADFRPFLELYLDELLEEVGVDAYR